LFLPRISGDFWGVFEWWDAWLAPRSGEKIRRTEFVAPVIEKFLEVRGAANLHFKGLRFHHTGYQLPPEGCPPMQAAAKIEATKQAAKGKSAPPKPHAKHAAPASHGKSAASGKKSHARK